VTVTVAIPVLDGARWLDEVLGAVRAQEVDREVQVLVADSGSRDASVQIARRHGAEVFAVEAFSHGATRNELMRRARGEHVAFLTQDATPAHPGWLAALLGGFAAGDDVAAVTGPYLARPGHEFTVGRELEDWFAALAGPGGQARVARRPPERRGSRVPEPAAFFSDANGAVARWAWELVPFRSVRYAEDRLLGLDVLDAGLALAYVPDAAVIHSHDYAPVDLFRRCFDEWRGLREVTGHMESARPAALAREVARGVRADRAWLRRHGRDVGRGTLRSLRHHALRTAGATLGSRADRLPPTVRRACSLEGRASFEPVPGP